jgi:hypothetical protein
MSEEPEQTVMVCMRISDAKDGQVQKDSFQTNCTECDAPIWMTPASHDQLVDVNAVAICTRCFVPPEGATLNPPTREVMKEILEHMLKAKKQDENTTDRFRGPSREGR